MVSAPCHVVGVGLVVKVGEEVTYNTNEVPQYAKCTRTHTHTQGPYKNPTDEIIII